MTAPISVFAQTVAWAKLAKVPLYAFDQIDSTNNFVKNSGVDADCCLVVADHQTHGRGRGAHTWSAASNGSYLLSSWVFLMKNPPRHFTGALLGLAVFRAAKQIWQQAPWNLKAPNDIWLDNKKVAGLLPEVITSGNDHRIVIGLGMNVLTHPAELDQATHLQAHIPNALSMWPEFLSALMRELQEALKKCTHLELDQSTRTELLSALNCHPLLSEPYLDVDASGNLRTSTRQISWTEL